MGDIVHLKKKEEWNAHNVFDYARENAEPDAEAIVIFTNRSGERCWSSNGFNNQSLLWALEEAKLNLLLGD